MKMASLKLLILFLFRFLCCCQCFNVNDNGNRFEFRVFENFQVTKEIFLKEQKIVENLRSIRQTLRDEQANVEAKLQLLKAKRLSYENIKALYFPGNEDNNSTKESLDPINSFGLLKRSALLMPVLKSFTKTKISSLRKSLSEIKSTCTEFPDEWDFVGAGKGLVILHDTYDFNITAAMEGHIIYRDVHGETKILRGRERLGIGDLLVLADRSYNSGYYSNAIEIVKVVLNKIQKEKLSIPKENMKTIKTFKKNLIDLNNQYVSKKHQIMGATFKVLPYLIDENLNRKKKQPKVVTENKLELDFESDFVTEHYFRKLCGTGPPLFMQQNKVNPPKCGFLHHYNPYLRLGPFKVEVHSRSPYMSVLHDILTEEEIKWMIEYSIPRLSRTREYQNDNKDINAKHELTQGKKVRIVHKTVQCWIEDTTFDGPSLDDDVEKFEDKGGYVQSLLARNFTSDFPNMLKLARKLEYATQMNIVPKYSSTPFQTTNYGLGGLCERHMDPHGYIEGKEIPKSRDNLKLSGDMYATLMGWLDDVGAGGGTAFTAVEKVIMPTRGSVAFWHNLDRKGHRDLRASHGGCPILKGSKWILNKWIYYFNQFQKLPCSTNPYQYLEQPQGYYRNINGTYDS